MSAVEPSVARVHVNLVGLSKSYSEAKKSTEIKTVDFLIVE